MDEILFVDHDLGSVITINQEGRNPVRQSLEGAFIYKFNDRKEVDNYLILGKYRASLADRGVFYPILFDNKDLVDGEGNKYVALITLPFFDRFNIAERFGKFDLADDKLAFKRLLEAFDTFEEVLPVSDFSADVDEEELEDVLKMVRKDYSSISTFLQGQGIELGSILNLISLSQKHIERLPRVAQHKDANPSNWRIVNINAKSAVNVIDMETLGLARRGWDEGRVYVQMCLDRTKQENFLEVLNQHPKFQSDEAKIYFWRVVLFRCIRELSLIQSGKYSSAISEYDQAFPEHAEIANDIRKGLSETAKQAIDRMQSMLKSE